MSMYWDQFFVLLRLLRKSTKFYLQVLFFIIYITHVLYIEGLVQNYCTKKLLYLILYKELQ